MAVHLYSNKKIKKVLPSLPVKKTDFKSAAILSIPYFVKYLVLLICIGLVIRQVIDCVHKLVAKPISTYTHFDFNKTIEYPSLTFCREPAYKYNELKKYGLYSHPRYTSTWRNFNFSATSLEELWHKTTYNESEVFVQYGLDGHVGNVRITSTLGFINGRCFTVFPKVLATTATRSSGYSITLKHSTEDVANNLGSQPPGYHVFVHYSKEPFTEVEVYNGGLVDYFLLRTGETIDVKLKVDEYKKLNKEHDPCYFKKDNYSTNACTTRYIWKLVAESANCSGPWMESKLPPCSNHTSMTKLISSYVNLRLNHDCSCPRLCHSHLYNAFVTDRHMYRWDAATQTMIAKGTPTSSSDLQIQLFVYFHGMMVSVYEERYNYDLANFVADLGGSIGFLLGLSVISLMTILGKAWFKLLQRVLPPAPRDLESVTTVAADDLDLDTADGKQWKHWLFVDVGNHI